MSANEGARRTLPRVSPARSIHRVIIDEKTRELPLIVSSIKGIFKERSHP